jgi:hypothetical protein
VRSIIETAEKVEVNDEMTLKEAAGLVMADKATRSPEHNANIDNITTV